MLRETFQRTFLRKAAGSFFLSVCFLIPVHPALGGLITIIPLGLPYQSYVGVFSFATAINNAGQVVGYTLVNMPLTTASSIPFLYSGGVLTNILGLNTVPIVNFTANGINNKGQIVGTCTPSSGRLYGADRKPDGDSRVSQPEQCRTLRPNCQRKAGLAPHSFSCERDYPAGITPRGRRNSRPRYRVGHAGGSE